MQQIYWTEFQRIESHKKKKNDFINDEIIKSANIFAFEKPSVNETKLLKIFFDLGEVFTGRFYSIKTFDDKQVVELKNKADDNTK